MTTDKYRAPQFRSIGLGIGLFLILLTLVCSLSQGVKWAGKVLSFIPESLGWITTVHRAEVVPLEMKVSPIQVTFPRADAYQIYTSDYDLLVISDVLAQSDAAPWIRATPAEGDSPVPITFVERGLMPYDTPFASGRPVMILHIPEAGTYALDFPTRQAIMTLVPDRTTGREGSFLALYAAQLLVVAAPFAVALYRREIRLRGSLRARRRSSQEKFERIRELGQDPEAGQDER